jgi:integrase
MPCGILTITLREVGPLPVLVDDNGELNRDVLAWFAAEKRDNLKAPHTLRGYATGLCKFTDYWRFHQETETKKPIFAAFFNALVHGQAEIGWKKGMLPDTAMRYVEAVCLFLDWYLEQIGRESEHPNPKIERPLSWGERLNQYRRRYKTDILFHLASSNKKSRFKNIRLVNPGRKATRGSSKAGKPTTKKFSFEDYLTLIRHERNPRNLMMWLLLGAGGLRVSEPLHLFINDVFLEIASGEAHFVFGDPTYGTVTVPDQGGGQKKLTRQEYLKQYFNLIPRDQLPDTDIAYAGWKGMKWHDTVAKTCDVIWLHPYFGRLFWKTHQEYLVLRGRSKPQHPWYFVNFKANTGSPLSESNIQEVFATTCRRLGIKSPHNPHALRHLYVDTLVNVCGLPLHQAQILARHRSPESTAIYALACIEAARLALAALAKKMLSLPEGEQLDKSSSIT